MLGVVTPIGIAACLRSLRKAVIVASLDMTDKNNRELAMTPRVELDLSKACCGM